LVKKLGLIQGVMPVTKIYLRGGYTSKYLFLTSSFSFSSSMLP